VNSSELTDLDLRLLRVLGALLDTGGVSRAAEALGVTPSAVSHSLAALRTRTGDQLFVRSAGGFSPTPRALAMRPKLQRALVDMGAVLAEEAKFDAATSTQQFSLSASPCLLEQLPAAIASIRRVAPLVRMKLLGISGPLSEGLASGEIDLAYSYGDAQSFLALDRETMRVSAGTDRFVCIMRPDHAALRAETFDLECYLEFSHVAVSMSAKARSVVNANLEALGMERRVILTVTDARAAVLCVANSDLIATVPESLAREAITTGKVVALTPPFDLPVADVYLWWHSRVHDEPSHRWWRGMILKHLCKASQPGIRHYYGCSASVDASRRSTGAFDGELRHPSRLLTRRGTDGGSGDAGERRCAQLQVSSRFSGGATV
jgi:DNA-binding transcriptional LysR family regulator